MIYDKIFKNKKGITLVELLITLAILSLVLIMAFSIFGFGQKTFAGGTKQYDLQSSIRLTEDYITKQIRYAPVVKLMDSTRMASYISSNHGILPYENFIYYDASKNCIIHENAFFKKELDVGKSGNILFRSTSTSASPSNEISFKISGQDGNKNFDVENKINCLNVHLSSDKRITLNLSTSGDSGGVIYFKSNDDFMAERLRPLATLDINYDNNSDEFHLSFIKQINSYSITTDSGVTSYNIDFSSPSTNFGFANIKYSTGTGDKTILFSLTFIDNLEYNYLAVFNGTDWTIK